MTVPNSSSPRPALLFMRHGATALNVAGLRCGGDIDLAMVDLGHQQVRQAAQRLAALDTRVGVIIVSDLQRTRQSAQIVARHLGNVDIVVEPAFNERRLGEWNRRPIADTQAELAAGVTPPGGESNAEFTRRIASAVVAHVLPRLAQRPLLVASKGVARVLDELAAPAARSAPGNADLIEFDLSPLLAGRALECAA
jgi:2,3-bisphosphoglycerate-dependent phosphoglycerate mutase